jgi:hypothetical protein
MKPFPPRFLPIFASSILVLSAIPSSSRAEVRPEREVRIACVQGDVRLSRGDGKHIDLDKAWEEAQSGDLAEQGYALSTGNGRAEIDFENGSSVFLAENSLLLFKEISAPGKRYVTRMTLATGTATFSLHPVAYEHFYLDTPTDTLTISPTDYFYVRIGAYLDATAFTPQAAEGDTIGRPYLPDLYIAKGHTAYFRGGELIEYPDLNRTPSSAHADEANSTGSFSSETHSSAFGEVGLLPLTPAGFALQPASPSPRAPQEWIPVPAAIMSQASAARASRAPTEWDNWVSTRMNERTDEMAAALKASGLSSPIPDLADLNSHGTFFPCEPYGTCWEPTEPTEPTPQLESAAQPALDQQLAFEQQSVSRLPLRGAELLAAGPSLPAAESARQQSPASTQSNTGFQPQTIQWQESWADDCGYSQSRTVTRVAHSQAELQEILRQRQSAQRRRPSGFFDPSDCYAGNWIYYRHHYARVMPRVPKIPPGCNGKCPPIHPPHPLWVRVGNKVGFVPRHPNDVPGKPPLNLKNGLFLPPSKPGERLQQAAWDSSQKVKVLDKVPSEVQREPSPRGPAVRTPDIHGRLVEPIHDGPRVPHQSEAHISYSYKTHTFTMPATLKGGKSTEVAVGGIRSNGKVGSFADGHSNSYASSFAHTTAAASYNGGSSRFGGYSGGHFSGSSSSSGGGHSSGSSSSGSFSAASHSSGGASSAASSGGGGGHAH